MFSFFCVYTTFFVYNLDINILKLPDIIYINIFYVCFNILDYVAYVTYILFFFITFVLYLCVMLNCDFAF